MASFDSLVKEVLPYVSGCPDTLVETNIRSATIDFAERSKAYVLDLDPITTVSGVFEYDFDQPSGTEVHQILWMTFDGNDMDPISPRSLELNYPDWRDRTSRPHVYLQKTPNTFWVVPVPQTTLTNGLIAAVALKPTRTTSNVDTTFQTRTEMELYTALCTDCYVCQTKNGQTYQQQESTLPNSIKKYNKQNLEPGAETLE